jgi:hypothetical protein
MIIKIVAPKIKHKPNVKMFVWNYDNLIKKTEIIYKDKSKIKKILNDKI